MAVTMEVAWRGAALGNSPVVLSKKRAWGADAEKLMQLMVGQPGSSSVTKPEEVTLDLLGMAAAVPTSPSTAVTELLQDSSMALPELDPELPLPSGWEKCLDPKVGELYFVNRSTGVRTNEDPRKLQKEAALISEELTPSPLAHEFLCSKRSEILREESLRDSTLSESSGGASPRDNGPLQLLSFSTGKQQWNLQLDGRSTPSLSTMGGSPGVAPFLNFFDKEDSNLELNLNLSAGRDSPRRYRPQQTVCTMEMVQRALKRTEKVMGKCEMPIASFDLKHSGSTSSLTSIRFESSWSYSSPSTSSASSTSSRFQGVCGAVPVLDGPHGLRSSGLRLCEAESKKNALVMGACTQCLMYVMLNRSNPKCPRCQSEVPLDFTSPPSPKRQRPDTTTVHT